MSFAHGDKDREIFNQYHRRLPNVNKFMEYAQSVAKTRGYVKTRLGRRLRFPRYGQHKAAGYLFQAYAADLHKVALIETDQYLRSEHAGRLLVSVHDEIGVSLPENTKHIPGIVAAYTNFNSESSRIRMKVPILASSSIGPNWWEASK
jgi:DNA polymerase I-like protein with 3'-5' exonuclease and polymerase domains